MWILSTVIRNSPICSQGQFPELTLCPLPDPFTEELNTTRVLKAENERENQYRSRSCPNARRQPKLQSELSVNLSPCWWFICICTGEDMQCQLTHISSWHNDRERCSILAKQQWNSYGKKKKIWKEGKFSFYPQMFGTRKCKWFWYSAIHCIIQNTY